jgi:hypothetical protein
MPIYEFFSPEKGKIYSFFARSSDYADKIPLCPDGKQFKMKKLLSGFSITGQKSETEAEPSADNFAESDDPFANMNEAQSAKMMRELEGAIGGMDDENPDPKQMGALMRKMCAMTGEKMDEGMEEVVRRLEEGTDPNELEERMSDFDFENNEQHQPDADEHQDKTKAFSTKITVRDPYLYEFEDYLQ